MDIIIALVVGAAAGGVFHFLMPGRSSRGAALAPILGAAVGGLVWLGLTWAGLTTLDPLLWLVSFVAPFAVVPAVLAVLTRTRAAHDARERIRLGIA
ncbi:hypothetical protein [Microbacterium telephonicum]|uniref:Uncharacterized protein n=1 Tax=Microbacterium telephonicum TaxID=1714841 RepID=A0A498C7X9_9MICO|nr:hypothetical protein [Microbacterium telephonicum]RLK49100.1 hypothetical protein C7474_1233 [Microbacterium telephonicum]